MHSADLLGFIFTNIQRPRHIVTVYFCHVLPLRVTCTSLSSEIEALKDTIVPIDAKEM